MSHSLVAPGMPRRLFADPPTRQAVPGHGAEVGRVGGVRENRDARSSRGRREEPGWLWVVTTPICARPRCERWLELHKPLPSAPGDRVTPAPACLPLAQGTFPGDSILLSHRLLPTWASSPSEKHWQRRRGERSTGQGEIPAGFLGSAALPCSWSCREAWNAPALAQHGVTLQTPIQQPGTDPSHQSISKMCLCII